MKTSSTTSLNHQSASRCIYTSSHGHRCRSLALDSSRYCFSHRRLQKSDSDSLISELSQAAASLSSPEDVNRVLGKIFMAPLQDRISTKKAGTLGFLGQMLIRSHREIEYYKKAHRQNEKELAAAEHHRQFLQQQDERRARIEAHHAELRQAEAEREAQAAQQAKKEAAAAAKAARKEAREAAPKPAPSVSQVAQASACVPPPNTTTQTNSSQPNSAQPKSPTFPPPVIVPPPVPPYENVEARWRAMTRGGTYHQR